MVADRNPTSYTYAEAAGILHELGFKLANPAGGGSHRLWRRGPAIVGLVNAGSGAVRPVYIRKMIRTLEQHDLLPPENDDALD